MRATPDTSEPIRRHRPGYAPQLRAVALGWLIGAAPLSAQLVITSNTSNYSNSGYTGTIIVRGATLSLAAGNALGNDAIVDIESDGILNITSEGEKFGNITGEGTVILGTSTLDIMANSQDSRFTGALDGSGMLQISTDASEDDTFTLGTNKISTDYTSDAYSYTGMFNIADANLALETAAGDHGDRLINVFDGPGDIRKTGGGTLTFGDNSTTLSAMLSPHDGALEIAEGILALDTSAGNYTLTHDYLKGAGTLGIKGDGTHTLTLTGDWDAFGDFAGDVRVFDDGVFQAGADDSLGDDNAVQIDSGGIFRLVAGEGFGSLSGQGTFDLATHSAGVAADNDNATFSGQVTGSGSLTKNGTGTWTLGGTGSNGDTNTPEDVLDGFSGNLVISAGTVAFDTSAGDATVDTTITGAGGIEKAGANTLNFSGTNTYTGGTTLTGGTLSIDADADLGAASGDITFNGGTLASTSTLTLGSGRAVTVNENGGTLETASSTTLTLDGVISGSSSATLAKTGAGTLTINATNTFSGLYDVSAGTLKIGTGNTLAADATVNLDGTGTILDLSAESEEFGILTGTGRVKLDDATIGLGHDSAGADFTFDGIIGETDDLGGFTKAGSGNLTLTGTSVYQGDTVIDGGTLTFGHATNTLRANSDIFINNDSTLAIGSNSDTVGAITLNSGNITGTTGTLTGSSYTVKSGNISAQLGGTNVTLTKSGSGTVTLAGNNSYTGDTTVTAGTLRIGASERIADASNLIVNGGTFDLTDLTGVTETVATVSGTGGTIDLGSGTLISTNATAQTYNGNITGDENGTFQKLGIGTLTLGGENTLTGTLDIQAGTVALGSTDNNALGSSSNVNVGENATFDISGQDEGFGTLTGSGNITLGTRDIFMNDGDFSGVISGSGEVNMNGTDTDTLILSGNSTHTGETNINDGTLALRGGNLASSTVDVKSGAVLDVIDQTAEVGAIKGAGEVRIGTGTLTAGGNDADTTFSGTINGTSEAELIKTGTGTLSVTSNLGFTGDVIINNGTLALGNGGSTGSGNPVLINSLGNLTFNNSNLTTLNTSFLTGTGSVTKEGNYSLSLSGTNSHTGATFINDGTLTLGRASALNRQSAVTIADGATLDTSRSTDGALLGSLAGAGDWVISQDLFPYSNNNMREPLPVTVGYDGTDTTFTGRVLAYDDPDYPYTRNAGEFTKVGDGILTLDTTDFGFETLNVQAGTLKLDVDDGSGGQNILDNDQIVVLSAGAVLDITADSEGFGGMEGEGGMVRMGSSDLTIGADGQFRIYSGGLNSFTQPDDSAPAAEPGDFIKTGTAFFRINGALASNLADFAGDYIINSGTLQFGTGNSDYSFEAGRLRGDGTLATTGSATSRLILEGDPLNFTGDFIVGTTILEFEVTAGNTVSIASDRIDGDDQSTLRKSGSGTFTMNGGDGGFTGDIEVTGGTFKSGGGGDSLSDDTSVDLVSGTFFVLTGEEKFGGITGDGGTFDLAGFTGDIGHDNATDALFSGSITSTGGGGKIIKDGSGKLTLSGSSSYEGGTEIRAGNGTEAGTLALGATNILPDTGSFHINGGIFDLATFDDTVGPVTLTSGSITGSITGSGTLTSSSYAVKSGKLSANIAGSGALSKTTSGTVTLSGSNNRFSGGVTISDGTLQTGNADALGTGAVTVNGGTLDLGGNTDAVSQVTLTSGTITNGTLDSSTGFDVRSGTVTVSGNFSGTGGLTKSTSGTVTLSGNNSYTGDTTVNDGTLLIDADDALSDSSDLVINGGTFDLDKNTDTVRSLAGSGGTLDLGSGTLITDTTVNTAFDGNVTGSGTLQKEGSGTLTLAGANGLTGTLDIKGGTVALGSTDNNALGGSATVNVGYNGTFNVSGQDEGFGTLTGAGTVAFGNDSSRFLAVSGGSFTGTFDGAGDFRHAGSGTYTLSTANLSTYSGELVSESGTLALDTGDGTHTLTNAITGSGDLQKTGTGTLTLSGLTTAGFTGNYAIDQGTLAIDTSNANLAITHDDLSGAAGTTLEKKGTGTLTLSGDWDTGDHFKSAVQVTDGTLAFGAGDVLSNSAVVTLANVATLDLSAGGENFGNLTGNGSVTLGSEGIGLGGNNLDSTFSGNISGNGGTLTKSGSAMLTLSGTNTYTEGTTIEAGTLRVSGGNALADNGAVTLANTEGATLDLNNSNETIGSLSGGGSNGGNVTLGTGTLTVGSGTFNGEIGAVSDTGGLTKVGSGTLTLNGTSRYQGATTIDGGTLTLGHATNTLRSNSSVSVNNGATLAIGSNSDTVGAITLNSGAITGSSGVLTGSSYTVKSGTVSAQLGTGTLTKTTGGTVTLAGENALTTVNIEEGTLALGSGNILTETATVNLTGGTLDISAEGEQIGNLTGDGGTVALGTQRLTVGLNNTMSTFTGGLSGSGELRKAGTETFTLGTGGITAFTGSIDLATNGFALSSADEANDLFGGTITGAGNLTKSGPGTVVLTGNNTYSGGTILAEGTLKVGSAGAINSTGTITFTGGTLQYGSANQTDYSDRFSTANNQAFSIDTNGQAVTFATSLISIDGTLTKKGSGTLTLANNNKYTGGTFLEGGNLVVGNDKALDDGSVTMAGGTTLTSNDNSRSLNNTIIVNGDVSFGGSDLELLGQMQLGGQNHTLSINNSLTEIRGVISNGGLTKSGSGTLALDGSNTYTGGTTISAGTLRISSSSALSDTGSVTVNGGTLDLRDNETVGTVRLASGNIIGSRTLTSNSAFNVESGTISANLAGTAALTKTTTGVVTLSGTNNTYSGDTLVQAGVLRLGAAGALSPNTTLNVSPGARFEANGHAAAFARLTGTGDIDVGSGGLTVSPSSGTNTFAGRLIGVGGLIKNGAGTLELSGTHTFTGETRIDAGRLRLNGSAASSAFRVNSGGILSGSGTLGSLTIASGGTLAPGNSPGTLSAGNTTWESGGTFEFEINDAAGIVSTNWDLLAISGTLTINALAGDQFTLDVDTLLSGTNTPGAMANFDANTSQEWIFVTTTGGITFGEGASIGASFAIETSGFANAINGSFSVSQIGNNLALSYAASAVPEPSSFALFAGLCGLGLAATRRRRRG